jgi:ABC-type polysaccharide/polyol phosphate export permease
LTQSELAARQNRDYGTGLAGVIESALADIRAALKMRDVWMALASEDIGDAHRRTLLGPAWLLLNYLAFTATIVMIIRSADGVENYAAFVGCSLLVWLYLNEAVNEGVNVFIREESFIKGTVLPLSVYVMRQTTRSVIRAGYALIGMVALIAFSGAAISLSWVTSLLALVLIVATTPALIVLLGFAGVFFPDIQFFVGNIMRLMMFITPVFWAHIGGGGLRAVLYHWNPFTHYLDIFRLPIVADRVPLTSWGAAIAISLALWAVAILLLGRYRKRIVFML